MRANGFIGPSRTLKELLPEGSVLSPLIFTIYKNDLLAEFKEDTLVSAYADDLARAHSARKKHMITSSLEPEVDNLIAWFDKLRLTLSTSKCVTAFFSLDCADAAWQANIIIDGKRM